MGRGEAVICIVAKELGVSDECHYPCNLFFLLGRSGLRGEVTVLGGRRMNGRYCVYRTVCWYMSDLTGRYTGTCFLPL